MLLYFLRRGDPIHKLLFDDRWSKKRLYNRSNRREELFFLLNQYCMILGRELGYDDEVAAAEAEEKMRLNGKMFGGMDEDPFMGGDTFAGNSPPTPGSLDHFLDDLYLPVKKEHAQPAAPAHGHSAAQDSSRPTDAVDNGEPGSDITKNSAAQAKLPAHAHATVPKVLLTNETGSSEAFKDVQFEPPRFGKYVKSAEIISAEMKCAQTSSSHEFLTPICIDETTFAQAQELKDSFTGAEEHELRAVVEVLEAEEEARARALLVETERSNILQPSEPASEHARRKDLVENPEELFTVFPPERAEPSKDGGSIPSASEPAAQEARTSQRPRSRLPKLKSSGPSTDDSLFSLAERTANLAAFKELMESLTSSASGSKNQPEPRAVAKTFSASDIAGASESAKKVESDRKGKEYGGKAAEKVSVTRRKTGIPSVAKKPTAVPVKAKMGGKDGSRGAVETKAVKESRLPTIGGRRK